MNSPAASTLGEHLAAASLVAEALARPAVNGITIDVESAAQQILSHVAAAGILLAAGRCCDAAAELQDVRALLDGTEETRELLDAFGGHTTPVLQWLIQEIQRLRGVAPSALASERDGFQPGWHVVELFGHGCCAGWVTETRVGGATMLRVQAPGEGQPRWYGGGAIYAMQACDEATAQAAARYNTLTAAGTAARSLALAAQRAEQVEALGAADFDPWSSKVHDDDLDDDDPDDEE